MDAVLAAKIIVALIWIFVILMVIVGNATHDGRSLYQSPTPVRSFLPFWQTWFHVYLSHLVLVLDRTRLHGLAYMGGVCMVLDYVGVFIHRLHSTLPMEPW